jgi:hypothetical protein
MPTRLASENAFVTVLKIISGREAGRKKSKVSICKFRGDGGAKFSYFASQRAEIIEKKADSEVKGAALLRPPNGLSIMK